MSSLEEEISGILSEGFLDSIESVSVAELRSRRDAANHVENLLSYGRRMIQARIDLLTQIDPHSEGQDVVDTVSRALTEPRSSVVTSARWVEVELNADDQTEVEEWISHRFDLAGVASLIDLNDASNAAKARALSEQEHGISELRKELHIVLDRLSSEVVRRYQSGEADVGSLLENEA